jgi:hypothetical protein
VLDAVAGAAVAMVSAVTVGLMPMHRRAASVPQPSDSEVVRAT